MTWRLGGYVWCWLRVNRRKVVRGRERSVDAPIRTSELYSLSMGMRRGAILWGSVGRKKRLPRCFSKRMDGAMK